MTGSFTGPASPVAGRVGLPPLGPGNHYRSVPPGGAGLRRGGV